MYFTICHFVQMGDQAEVDPSVENKDKVHGVSRSVFLG